MSIIAAVTVGAVVVFLIVRRQVKGDVPDCCRNCRYGSGPSDCSPPADAAALPPDCDKSK